MKTHEQIYFDFLKQDVYNKINRLITVEKLVKLKFIVNEPFHVFYFETLQIDREDFLISKDFFK